MLFGLWVLFQLEIVGQENLKRKNKAKRCSNSPIREKTIKKLSVFLQSYFGFRQLSVRTLAAGSSK